MVEEELDKALGRTTWKNIAAEGQSFTFNPAGTYTVRFGANGVWVQKSITNAGACSVAEFGSDPVAGVLKSCQVRSSTVTVTLSGTAASSSGSTGSTSGTTAPSTGTPTGTTTTTTEWTKIADEWASFTTSQSVTVRFGTATQFVDKTVNGSGQCTGTFFGRDPAVGVVKACYTQNPAAAPWVKIVDEGASFSTNQAAIVRFGTATQFVERSVNGSAQCTNGFFGSDPAPGVVKSCSTQNSAAVSSGSGTSGTTSTTTSTSTSTSTASSPPTSSSGPPSADGTVVAALMATRTSGPAPLAVFFDATGTTVSSGNAFHGLRYEFTFGDERSQTWQLSGLSRNTQSGGPIAAHIFDIPGNYTVRVRVTSLSGAVSEASVSVTVQDPNTVYGGASTMCVSAVSDFTGCPTGAATATVLPTAYGGRRVLLRRGESFPQVTVRFADDNVVVGAYGTGPKPRVQKVAVSEGRPTVAGQFADEVTIMDLDIANGIVQGSSGSRHLYYRNDLVTPGGNNNIDFGSALGYWSTNSGLPESSFYEPREMFFVDNRVQANTTTTAPLALMMGQGSRVAIMGNDMGKVQFHNIRLWAAHKTFIAHNAMRGQSYDGIRHSLKVHSGGLAAYGDTRDPSRRGWATAQVVVANNLFGDPLDNNSWTMELSPQNTSSNEGLEDAILENNRFIRGTRTNTEAILVGRRMTSRGNSRVDGGVPNINSAPTIAYSTPADWQGPYWFSGWTVASLDIESLPPTASGRRSQIEWVLDLAQASNSATLDVSADATVGAGGEGITYRAALSEEAASDMTVALSNGAEIVIRAGSRTGSVTVPLGSVEEGDLGEDRAIQVYVTRVEGGGFGQLAVNDSQVRTVIARAKP